MAGPSGTADRATDIIGRIRALVRSAPPQNDQLDVNETMLEVIALTRGDAQQRDLAADRREAGRMQNLPGSEFPLLFEPSGRLQFVDPGKFGCSAA